MTTLRQARLRTGLSIRALAARLKKSSAWLSMVEAGKQRPTPIMLELILEECGIGAATPDSDEIHQAMGIVPADIRLMVLAGGPAIWRAIRNEWDSNEEVRK